jgi:N6-L-threonylcarbamoyladenine synthase
MIVLGIESSCDETAASVVVDGSKILSSVVSSQVDIHRPYGGVVPELASRNHIRSILTVYRQAIKEAGVTEERVNALAVTQGPGLVGSLLVGFSFAKAVAMVLDIPWVGVSHLTGHLNSVFLESDPPDFPFVALLVSGGHTSLYYVRSHTESDLLGQTRDDAAGEAFDKVAKMLGLGYPGGGVISELARKGDSKKIHFPRSYLGRSSFDFSFSGLKTAVNRYIKEHSKELPKRKVDIAAGFQEAVVDVLVKKLIDAALSKGCNRIALVGGVAANDRLRSVLRAEADRNDLSVHIPSLSLCGDNAAMIAATGYHFIKEGYRSNITDDVYSRQPIELASIEDQALT